MNSSLTSSIYSERCVAFIDILGFSAIVNNSITSPEQASNLAKILSQMTENTNSDIVTFSGDDFKTQTFSDCIVISESASDHGLSHLVWIISQLERDLLAEGILTRGGIAEGLLHHSERIVFGPALIEAYRLESTTAIYPRVVVDRRAHQHFKRFQTNEGLLNDYNQLRFDDDGPVFVDFLAPFRRQTQMSAHDLKNMSRC